MSKNKRLIYISDDLLEIYDSLINKSEFISQKLRELRSEDTEDKGSEFDEKIKRLRGRSSTDSRAK